MNRREFVSSASAGMMFLPFLQMPAFMKELRMGIVVHSYAHRWQSKAESLSYPGFRDALDLLAHCHAIGAGGIQVVMRDWSNDFSKKVRDKREQLGMYIEGSIALPSRKDDVAIFERDIAQAREAGASVVRTVCLSGRRYENFQSAVAFEQFRKDAITSLQLAEPVVRKHRMRLAVENHKDWRAGEMVTLLSNLQSEWIGVTLDFGNNIALLEDPIEVANALAPYVFSTHVKDMGLASYPEGFLLSEVPLGKGVVDLQEMVRLSRTNNKQVTFNLEMITRDPLKIPCLTPGYWATLPDVTGAALARILRLVHDRPFQGGLPEVTHLSSGEKLAVEEENVLASLSYSREQLAMN